jgi:hypothetical protein
MDVQTIIEKAGGVGKLASTLGVSHSTVCDWKRLGFIPSRRIMQISRTLGLPAETVAGIAQQHPTTGGEPDGEAA